MEGEKMFVRWKKRPYVLNTHENGITCSAYLVESRRVGGKVCQKNLGYLGSIREQTHRWLYGEPWPPGKEWSYGFSTQCSKETGDLAQAGFYTELRRRMNWLQLTDEQQAHVEQQVSKLVPHMTAEACEACKREKRRQRDASYRRSLQM
jgi:hypothetical protein